MNTDDPLDTLLERLTGGDDAAAEEVFRTYEPYLRMMVRRRLSPALRIKFDSMDVVQSVWADVLRGFREAGWKFQDRNHLRAFLARLAYNRFIDNCRRHRRSLEHERPLDLNEEPVHPTSEQPRPSQVAQADELWEKMLALCPPAHREFLELRRRGVPLAEIATRTGLHPSSVRRIFYDLRRRLAASQGDLPTMAGPEP